MNCLEFQELITAEADRELDTDSHNLLQQHLQGCQGCRSELALERATKAIVSACLPFRPTPQVLREKVGAMLRRKYAWGGRWWFFGQGFESRRGIFLALGGVIAVAACIVLLVLPVHRRHSHTQPADGDVIHQTYNNFDSILQGTMVPQVVSGSRQTMIDFLQARVDFPVAVPSLRGCTLVGGCSTVYERESIAHLIYKHGEDVVYLYEVDMKDVMNGGVLYLSPEAKEQLFQNRWYAENHAPDCSLVIWLAESIVCSAIADINREELLTTIHESQ